MYFVQAFCGIRFEFMDPCSTILHIGSVSENPMHYHGLHHNDQMHSAPTSSTSFSAPSGQEILSDTEHSCRWSLNSLVLLQHICTTGGTYNVEWYISLMISKIFGKCGTLRVFKNMQEKALCQCSMLNITARFSLVHGKNRIGKIKIWKCYRKCRCVGPVQYMGHNSTEF